MVVHPMQGNADFDAVNTCIGFKVTLRAGANAAAQTDSSPQVYIGVCPAADCSSDDWNIDV